MMDLELAISEMIARSIAIAAVAVVGKVAFGFSADFVVVSIGMSVKEQNFL